MSGAPAYGAVGTGGIGGLLVQAAAASTRPSTIAAPILAFPAVHATTISSNTQSKRNTLRLCCGAEPSPRMPAGHSSFSVTSSDT